MLHTVDKLGWGYNYVHKSIAHSIKRRADLEYERVECMWVAVKHSSSKATLVGYVYRNPAATYAWLDDFVDMMDKSMNVTPTLFY